MPTYLTPGVYVEEVDRGTKPIEGVGTAVAAGLLAPFVALRAMADPKANPALERSRSAV